MFSEVKLELLKLGLNGAAVLLFAITFSGFLRSGFSKGVPRGISRIRDKKKYPTNFRFLTFLLLFFLLSLVQCSKYPGNETFTV